MSVANRCVNTPRAYKTDNQLFASDRQVFQVAFGVVSKKIVCINNNACMIRVVRQNIKKKHVCSLLHMCKYTRSIFRVNLSTLKISALAVRFYVVMQLLSEKVINAYQGLFVNDNVQNGARNKNKIVLDALGLQRIIVYAVHKLRQVINIIAKCIIAQY